MPTLVFENPSGPYVKVEATPGMRLGSAVSEAEGAGFRLPAELDVRPEHAVLARSELYKIPLLVDRTGGAGETRVNGLRVAGLRFLRHRDRIHIGKATLTYWELMPQHAADFRGKTCVVCYRTLEPPKQVILCPHCDMPYHRQCWCVLVQCAILGCGYRVQDIMCKILAPRMRFERMQADHELVKKARTCGAGSPKDRAPFKTDELVAFCPRCDTPFHSECWLGLKRCPRCEWNVAAMLREATTPNWQEVER